MREKLIELLGDDVCKHSDCEDCEANGSTDACIAILKAYMADHLIANGVTIPVRCKDCKHYMTIHCTCDGCCISDDWYCADGERKDNG